MELLLAQCVPDLRLHPVIGAFDVIGRHWENLDYARLRFEIFKLVKDAPISQRCLADPTIANKDQLVIQLAWHAAIVRCSKQ